MIKVLASPPCDQKSGQVELFQLPLILQIPAKRVPPLGCKVHTLTLYTYIAILFLSIIGKQTEQPQFYNFQNCTCKQDVW